MKAWRFGTASFSKTMAVARETGEVLMGMRKISMPSGFLTDRLDVDGNTAPRFHATSRRSVEREARIAPFRFPTRRRADHDRARIERGAMEEIRAPSNADFNVKARPAPQYLF